MKGGEILIECLKAQGVSAVFGMPGTQNIQIYDALLQRGGGAIDHYLVRHEYAATQMADGFARATGEPGVAITVPGPGASNASTGILEAFTDCAPVLLITGQSDSSLYSKHPSKMFHGLDQMRFFESITKYCAIAHTVAEIPVVVENAFKAMRNGRPGPTMLEFPMDVVTGEGDVRIPPRVERIELPAPDDADLSTAVETIRNAKMPVIFAGSAVFHSNARNELRLLAEKLNAPVIVTRNGKGVLPEDHPLALQICYGYLGREALERCDCLIGIGPRFTSIDTRNWSLELPQPFIQIDEDANEIGLEYPCDVGVVGDLKLTLQALIEDVAPGQNEWDEVLTELRAKFDVQPSLPVIHEFQDVLPRDTIYAIDVHALGYASFAEFPIYDPRTFLYPNIGVALGHAYPAAIGAKVAHPDRPVICFSGDGGFLMGAVEMATAVKYGINVVAIVVNDGALSAIKGSQLKGCEGRTIDTDLLNPDFVEFARSFGAYAKRVENLGDFKETLRDALAAEKPALIEVMLQERQDDIINIISWLQTDPLRKTPFYSETEK
ncbi:MAG: thiamine pyrophosphate-binding protein [Candidatus Poribacteria bacterium]|nr:thiamine pyrophosphate-binding protein [Candidatus Poribacteria bacterium]